MTKTTKFFLTLLIASVALGCYSLWVETPRQNPDKIDVEIRVCPTGSRACLDALN